MLPLLRDFLSNREVRPHISPLLGFILIAYGAIVAVGAWLLFH
jgi:hypothetical protein